MAFFSLFHLVDDEVNALRAGSHTTANDGYVGVGNQYIASFHLCFMRYVVKQEGLMVFADSCFELLKMASIIMASRSRTPLAILPISIWLYRVIEASRVKKKLGRGLRA